MIDRMEVRTKRGAAVLGHGRARAILLALAARECALRALAEATGLSLTLLHYHVGVLRRLGFVEIVREEKRAGRAVKVYRAAARSFFVPAELMDRSPGEALLRELAEALARGRARSGGEGTLYGLGEDGRPLMRRLRPETAGEAAEYWAVLNLGASEAAALAAEMKALLGRYRQAGSGRGRAWLVHAAVAPR